MSPNKKPLIGICAKPTHPRSVELTQSLMSWLEDHGYPYSIDTEISKKLEKGDYTTLERAELAKQADVIVVLGGDGTFISASHHPRHPAPIVIGVNLGTMGFLTEIMADELLTAVDQVLSGKAELEPRYLLETNVMRNGKQILHTHAMNDVVLTKEALARIFATDLSVNGQSAAVIRGDGIIISTPGGSTAYSLAAGGSIVHPQVEAILITSICPHSLTCRPLVLPGSSEIRLKVASDTSGELDKVHLTIDGQEGMPLQGGDEISVTTSDYSILVAKSPSNNYFDLLETKLNWANR